MRRGAIISPRRVFVGTPTFSAVQRSGTTITFDHITEDTPARVLLVWVCYSDLTAANITGVTYNGVGMTNKTDQTFTTPFGADSQFSLFHMYNPPAGSNSVVVTKGDSFSASDGGFVMAVVLSGVDSTIYDTGVSLSAGSTLTSIQGFITPPSPDSLLMEVTCIEAADTQVDGTGQVRLGNITFDQSVVNLGYSLSYKYAKAAYNAADTTDKSWTNSVDAGCLVVAIKRI
jgi:hypothetical protein